ncbi:MAG: hypothetical protein ICV82_07795, partial [Nitrososphaera sp.]|nr:hypothetical protein [Nitrososphaera sp.]
MKELIPFLLMLLIIGCTKPDDTPPPPVDNNPPPTTPPPPANNEKGVLVFYRLDQPKEVWLVYINELLYGAVPYTPNQPPCLTASQYNAVEAITVDVYGLVCVMPPGTYTIKFKSVSGLP